MITQQSTNNWLNIWKSWTSQKGLDQSTESYEPKALNKIVDWIRTQQFVRKTGAGQSSGNCDCNRPVPNRERVHTLCNTRPRI